ncbi:GntR family transcriptional regulator [Weissella coleopterorum]|uniref:GntR family transcriptional regulator n=1 Tax=Weissella coleopterorum TaxID=2714949 RepID=A0A6G8B1L2_9LACO|nr:GntR family transcriptional regulator [Weissella coleopterorum]QIL51099.1 GntR family transcriptional regulator [Weissella coleopterorum]
MTEPIYVQIHDEIKESIDAGRWSAGDRIPSERELSLQFNVSRMTLRQSIILLVDEGYLERRIGSGTFVATQRFQESLDSAFSFTEMMDAVGKKASSQVINYKVGVPTGLEAEKLQISLDTSVIRMERVRYGDDEPIAFEVAIVPYELLVGVEEEVVTQSLYQALMSKGLIVNQASRTLTATSVNERVARLLDMKSGEPVLVLTQVTTDDQGSPFEFVRTQYAGSRYEFKM